MRILQISKYFYPAVSFGGPVQCIYNISKCLFRRGHEVTVYTTDALDISSKATIKESFYMMNGVKVFFFRNIARPYKFFISPRMIFALQKNSEDFDVVHLHEYRTFQNLAFFFPKKRPPYVLSAHGEISPTYGVLKGQQDLILLRSLFDRGFGRKLVRSASKLIATTNHEANQYLQAGVDRNKIEIIPNGIAPEEFSNPPPLEYFREFFGIREEEMILYLGRIHRRKGIDILVKAFSILLKERKDVKLVIAGADDGFLGPLKRIVMKLNLRDKILFTGALTHKQLLAAYNDATVVTYPGFDEIFGIVPIEAAFCQKPVIATKHCGMSEVILEGEFGILVDYGNAFELKEALAMLIDDREKARRLGENGKKYVLKELTWNTVVEKLETVYQSLL